MTIDIDEDDGFQAEDLAGIDDGPAPERPRWLLSLLAGVVAVSLLIAGGAMAVIFGVGSSASTVYPTEGSIDVGFARDMSTHHRQAVEMAGVARDNSTDPAIRLLAYDIESTQQTQAGQMSGMLLAWGRPQYGGAQMTWMAGDSDMVHDGMNHVQSNGLMPGMATEAELAKLKTLTGKAQDIYFLQLMLRHHEGGLPMAQYAATNAKTQGVRDLATGMAKAQAKEIVLMEQLLRERGASPLPTS